MKNFNDKELKRLLEQADNLLSDIQVYETPMEEQARKQKEEQERLEEQQRLEEQRRLEELQRQEEQRRLEEQQRQEEQRRLEELQRQEEQRRLEEQQRQAEQQRLEELRQIEEQQRQAEQQRLEELRQIEEQQQKAEQQHLEELRQLEEKQRQIEQQHLEELRQLEEKQRQIEEQYLIEQQRLAEQKAQEEIKDYTEAEIQEAVELPVDLNSKEEAIEVPADLNSKEEAIEVPADLNSNEKAEEVQTEIEPKKETEFPKIWEIFEKPKVQERIEKPKELKFEKGFCLLFLILSFGFMELVTHLSLYRSLDSTIIYPIIFAIGLSCIIAIVTSLFDKRINTIGSIVLLLAYGSYCDLQILHHAVTGAFMGIADIKEGIGILLQNQDVAGSSIGNVVPWMVLMFLPVILWAALGRTVIQFEKGSWTSWLILLFAGMIIMTVGILTLDIHGYEANSPYVCFYHFDRLTNLEATGKQLGMFVTFILDVLG